MCCCVYAAAVLSGLLRNTQLLRCPFGSGRCGLAGSCRHSLSTMYLNWWYPGTSGMTTAKHPCAACSGCASHVSGTASVHALNDPQTCTCLPPYVHTNFVGMRSSGCGAPGVPCCCCVCCCCCCCCCAAAAASAASTLFASCCCCCCCCCCCAACALPPGPGGPPGAPGPGPPGEGLDAIVTTQPTNQQRQDTTPHQAKKSH